MSYESCIHYKFGNTTNFCSIKFQGLEISLSDLKVRIIQANHMNHSPLEIINSQNKKVYYEDSEMIPRNTSVIVKRIPPPQSNHSSKVIIASQRKRAERDMADRIQSSTFDVGNQEANLSKIDESEENKLKTMMDQASIGFEQSVRKSKENPSIRCYRCERLGHHRDKCPLISNANAYSETPRKRPKGIPSTMLEIIPEDSIDKHNIKEGVYVNRKGDFVIPIVDKMAMGKRLNSSSKNEFTPCSQQFIPNELQCKLCYKIFTDAVVIQCCGNSFCDECIRTYLINNNFHCPLTDCGQGEILPDNLVPNQHLRKTVKHFLGNIAEEKYNSHPITSQLYSPEGKCTTIMMQKFEGVEEATFTKKTVGEVLRKPSRNENLKDIQTQDSFVPIPFLFNSHNLYISSFRCNTVPSTPCEPTLLNLTEPLQPHKTNIENYIGPNQQLSIPCRFESENTDSLSNLDSQFYPILSEKEFYLQQTLYRKKQSKTNLPYNNVINEIASNNTFSRKSNKKDRKLSHLKNVIKANQTGAPAKVSFPSLTKTSLESNDFANFTMLKGLPNSSKITSTEEYTIYSGQLIESPINNSKLNAINSNFNEKLIFEPVVFQENSSIIKKHNPSEDTDWNRTNKSKNSTDEIFFDTTEGNRTNINLSRSLINSPLKSKSRISPTPNAFSAPHSLITYDNDENDIEKNDSLVYSVLDNSDSSGPTFQSLHTNNPSCLKYLSYKGVNNVHQCRLQSTVKKVLSNVSEDTLTLTSQKKNSEHINHDIKGFVQMPDSSNKSSEDSSELEDGQIVSSGSGSKCVPIKKKPFKPLKNCAFKLKKKYLQVNSSKTNESNCYKKYLKNQTRGNSNPKSKVKTPDRIVVIKPSSKLLFQSRNNQTLLQRSRHKIPISIHQTLPVNSRNRHQQKHSRLLMTKTEDQRIVKIQTTKKFFFPHSNISFSRAKLHQRKQSGYI